MMEVNQLHSVGACRVLISSRRQITKSSDHNLYCLWYDAPRFTTVVNGETI